MTTFGGPTLSNTGTGPKTLSRLNSITTDFSVLLLFHNSRIYTPALRSLTITSVCFVSDESWRAYAEDENGGANITNVDFALSIDVRPEFTSTLTWFAFPSYLCFLPKLSTLTLQAQLVEPILKVITTLGTVPLGVLRVLSIIDYDGDGQQIVSFARAHLEGQDSYSESDPSSTDGIDVLSVELRNCPNISAEVMAELTEISAILAVSE